MADISYPLSGKKIWIAGETGMVGRALQRRLSGEGCEILSAPHAELDLCDQASTHRWLAQNKPDAIFMAAAKVGGIGANTRYPAEFIADNLSIAHNVIDGAHRAGVDRLLFLGSSCIYPKEAAQPIREESLLTGPLEPTNEGYAIAKIAGVKMCQAYRRQYGRRYISAMPTNLYGPDDHYHPENSHVIPAMLLKFRQAKAECREEVELWGTGRPMREFLHVDDLADALVLLMERYEDEAPVNIGSGEEISIHDLAEMIREITGYTGHIKFNPSMPDGTMRKALDCRVMKRLGWLAKTSLRDGVGKL